MIRIIGISGKKQSGKDTVANRLVNKHHFIKLSFGDNVKKALQDIFNFTDEQLWGDDKEKVDENWNIVPRDLMQYFGTELMRNEFSKKYIHIGKDIWIKSLQCKLDKFIEHGFLNFVIPDVRFNNEINFIKSYNGVIINVSRTQENISYNQHESEINDLYFDYKIINSGTIDELHRTIDNLIP